MELFGRRDKKTFQSMNRHLWANLPTMQSAVEASPESPPTGRKRKQNKIAEDRLIVMLVKLIAEVKQKVKRTTNI